MIRQNSVSCNIVPSLREIEHSVPVITLCCKNSDLNETIQRIAGS